MEFSWSDAAALVTGGAKGIGAGVARRLARRGTKVLVVDVDEEAGPALAEEVGGRFLAADVGDLEANHKMVGAALDAFGRLDLVHLNAGVTTGCSLGDDFDPARYRRAMGVNLDGIVYGIHAALPALGGRPGAQIVVTASLAGLTGVPPDPVYSANKHAVVGLVRSLGGALEVEHGVRLNALCPGFADTSLVGPEVRAILGQLEIPLLEPAEVVDAFCSIIDGDGSGQCWFVQVGRPSEPFHFANLPGPRTR